MPPFNAWWIPVNYLFLLIARINARQLIPVQSDDQGAVIKLYQIIFHPIAEKRGEKTWNINTTFPPGPGE